MLGALALAFAAGAQDRGKLLGLKAAGDAKASVVLISADRPLSFTTMKLSDPPRVVVDFADTEIAFSRRELTVEDGTVRRVAAAPAGSRTARVVVELQADAEFDVRTARNRIQLRIARRPALASREDTPSPAPSPQPPPSTPTPAAAPEGSRRHPKSSRSRLLHPPRPRRLRLPTKRRRRPLRHPRNQRKRKPHPHPNPQRAPAPEPAPAPERAPSRAHPSPAEAAKDVPSPPEVSLVGSAPRPLASHPKILSSHRPRQHHRARLSPRGRGRGRSSAATTRSTYGVTADAKGVLLHLPERADSAPQQPPAAGHPFLRRRRGARGPSRRGGRHGRAHRAAAAGGVPAGAVRRGAHRDLFERPLVRCVLRSSAAKAALAMLALGLARMAAIDPVAPSPPGPVEVEADGNPLPVGSADHPKLPGPRGGAARGSAAARRLRVARPRARHPQARGRRPGRAGAAGLPRGRGGGRSRRAHRRARQGRAPTSRIAPPTPMRRARAPTLSPCTGRASGSFPKGDMRQSTSRSRPATAPASPTTS